MRLIPHDCAAGVASPRECECFLRAEGFIGRRPYADPFEQLALAICDYCHDLLTQDVEDEAELLAGSVMYQTHPIILCKRAASVDQTSSTPGGKHPANTLAIAAPRKLIRTSSSQFDVGAGEKTKAALLDGVHGFRKVKAHAGEA
jgi:hypothetical protein